MIPLLSIAYLPPVSYLQECMRAGEIAIDQHEHFIKQTYRNRCEVYAPNGKQDLIIPAAHENIFRIPIRDVKISQEVAWNKVHWKTITSSYRNSPYFEFFEDEFRELFEKPGQFLFEFNLKLLEKLFRSFKANVKISLTESFEKNPSALNDLRNSFHPKKRSVSVNPYHQVFSDRHGFLNDLSCIDLLFNAGP